MRTKFLLAFMLLAIAAFGQQNPIQIDANGLTQTFGAGGIVTRGQIVKINSAGQVVPMATTDTSGAIGIAATSQQNVGQVIAVSIGGSPLAQVDGSCSPGNLVGISSSTGGSGHCGTTVTGQFGIALTAASNGFAQVQWTGAGGSSTSGGLPSCTVTQTSCLGAITTAAVADWRQAATDGTCTNSSTAISWGTPNEITAADIGKVIDIFSQGGGNTWQNTAKTTIATVTSTTTGTMSLAAASSGCGTPVTFNVYTDNAAAFNGPELAIHNSTSHKGIIYYPCGTYGVASPFWNQTGANDSVSYWGGGTGHSTSTFGQCTLIKVSPAIMVGQNGTGLAALNPASGDMRDLVLDGQGIKLSSNNGLFLTWAGVMNVSNVQVYNFIQTAGQGGNLCNISSNNFQANNLVCVMQDGPALTVNSRNITMVNGYFTGSPGLGLSACYGTFTGGQVGLNATAGTNGALNTAGGAGSVYCTFYGTQFSNGNTTLGATVQTTNPSAHSVVVNLIEPNFNCQGTSAVPILNVGSTTTVQWIGRGAIPVEGTLGCGGTLPITNNGILHASNTGFQSAAMTVSWTGSGTYFFTPDAFPVAPTLTGTGACATITTQKGGLQGQATCTGVTAASTFILGSLGTTPNGWSCSASDVTHTLVGSQSAVSTTGCTITLSSVTTNDVITFAASPF